MTFFSFFLCNFFFKIQIHEAQDMKQKGQNKGSLNFRIYRAWVIYCVNVYDLLKK